ncbi:NAD-dependent epimerase/dehydratase family protein [Jiangella gansuensis]|uniref:NAD-dependent epimerase/dehydratase family protein n=1 Tax=Jiangella gansuensis TaxID=281473 RepID=UPI0004B1B373|nr:NAD(P)-dependent oxidoreductase [Jiangella gansuensis]
MRLLVIGGSGDVGRLVVPALAERHELLLFDIVPPPEPVLGEYVPGSVTDPDALRAAVRQRDAIVYLAMGSKQGWGTTAAWAASNFDVNVTGVHLTLWAAAEAGITQIVHTSSASVFADYTALDHAAGPEPDADDTYGLSKRLGEQVCAAAARRNGMSITALRLVGPMPDDEWQADDTPLRDVVTAGSDVASAYLAALEHPRPGFHTYLVTGDADGRTLDWSATEADLGWRPRARRSSDAGRTGNA